MTTNVEDMTRLELENALMIQSGQLKILIQQVKWLKASKETLEEENETLSNVLMGARQLLNSGLSA